MFDDRRKSNDRRVRRDPAAIPPAGCRRHNDRRNRARRYQAHPWWLQATYAEEVEPPQLNIEPDSNSSERRVIGSRLTSLVTSLSRRKGNAPA